MGIEVIRGELHAQTTEAVVVSSNMEDLPPGEALLAADIVSSFRGTIEVRDHDRNGRSSSEIVERAVRKIIAIVERESYWSVAIPVLGCGPGALAEAHALAVMLQTLYELNFMGGVTIVRK